MMKYLNILFYFLCFTFICGHDLCAQTFEIESQLSHSGSVGAANMPCDNNGNPCARIRIDLPIDNVSINGSYIVGEPQKVTGGYIIYVAIPKKQGQKITIRHNDFSPVEFSLWSEGPLVAREEYTIKIKCEKASSYVVDMHGKKIDVSNSNIEVIMHEDAGGQFLILAVEPKDAFVYIDGKPCTTNNGVTSQKLSYGKHTYKVDHPMYDVSFGEVVMSKEKQTIEVKLDPKFGFLKISSTPEEGAEVYLDGKKFGVTPLSIDSIIEGNHIIRIFKDLYDVYEDTLIVERGETKPISVNLSPNYGTVTLICDDQEAEIYINNKKIARGSWSGRLNDGLYSITTEKPSHRSGKTNITVEPNKDQKIILNSPTPMYGSLEITSDPIGAEIYIDGVKHGVTPEVINNILIGKHEIVLSTSNMMESKDNITIDEGRVLSKSYTLTTCDPVKLIKIGDDFFNRHDIAQAIPYYQKAADSGNVEALYKLADCSYSTDINKCMQYLTLAAEKNHPTAQSKLGSWYLFGMNNIPQDKSKGLKWLKNAAENNEADALEILGVLYLDGDYGLEESKERGREYLRKAISLGNIKAKCELAKEYGLNFDCYGPKYAKAGRYMLAKLANEGYQPAIETCSKKGINYENTRIKPEVNTSKDSYDISYSTNYGESLPHYPGGDIALFTEIDKILEHLGYTGEFGFVEFVEVEFVVSTDGKIINEHCNYYLFPTLNQEYSKLTTDVLRSLKKRFYPAKNRSGNEINCKVRLKIPVRI